MDWRSFIPHGIFFGGLLGLVVAAIVIPITRKREIRITRKKVEKAREHILANGKIKPTKGPYVPHQKWKDSGTPYLTDGETKSPQHGGYYGTG